MTTTNALFMGFKAKILEPDSTALVPTGDGLGTSGLGSETLIECVLTDNTDVDVSEVTHTDRGDISAAFVPTPVVMTGTAITNPTSATVRWDANDVTFTSVSGDSCEQIVIYQNVAAGTNDDDLLICKFGTATGLPVTPNGGNIVVQWNASGIFEW